MRSLKIPGLKEGKKMEKVKGPFGSLVIGAHVARATAGGDRRQ